MDRKREIRAGKRRGKAIKWSNRQGKAKEGRETLGRACNRI